MIFSLRGVVQHVAEDELVLELGSVGLQVAVPRPVLDDAEVGKPLFLLTKLVIRDTSIAIYGFNSADQRNLFELLMQVSGVGPRLALSVLSHLSADVLQSAVVNDQPEVVSRVPGVGRKTAEKIVFHLKDRLKAPLEAIGVQSEMDTEVLSVLTALGYNLVEAQAALQSIPPDTAEDVEQKVKQALRYFAQP
ncbi:MAG: Holliday junction branch migration protein RuvA [Anaerolineales bacterium]|nr:Holliday junction branch migration protein RuvA [Anaerolineales bacterium]